MKDKEFELKSERHSFTNQVANDSKYFKSSEIKLENLKLIYDGSKESVIYIMDLVGFQTGILNCWDYNPPKLLFLDKFFEVGTEFMIENGEIWTKDKSNFGYKFKDGKIIGTINWVELS